MSLDITLVAEGYEVEEPCTCCGAVRAGVHYPTLWETSITHNLNKMAQQHPNLYEALWRPAELGITRARELVPILSSGLDAMRAEPGRFKAWNPPNKWGDYDGLVTVIAEYLAACGLYPDALVQVFR